MSEARDKVAVMLHDNLPAYARSAVREDPSGGFRIDWQQLIEHGRMLSSGEQAVVRLAAHLLDVPGVACATRTTFVGLLQRVSGRVRAEVLACLADVNAAMLV